MNGSQQSSSPVRVLNIKALLILVVVTPAIVGGVYLLHSVQVKRSADKMLVQAERAERDGNFEQATRNFSHYMSMRPKDKDAQAKFGRALAKTAKTPMQRKTVADTLRNSAGVDPARVDDLLTACENYAEIGLFDEGRDNLKIVLQTKPNDPKAQFYLAVCQLGLKERDAAVTILQKAIKDDPTYIKSSILLADIYRRLYSLPERADNAMNSMVAANTTSAAAYLARARYRLTWRLPKAGDDIEQAARLKADESELLSTRAEKALLEGKTEEALGLYREGVKKFPDNTQFVWMQARLESQMGRSADALKTLRAGIEKFPESKELAWSLADTMIANGEVKEARNLIDKLRAIKYREAHLDFLDALIALSERNWDRALTLLEKATPNLDNVPDVAMRAYLALGMGHERINSLDAALVAYKKALSINPDSAMTQQRVARVLMALGKPGEAAQMFRPGEGASMNQVSGLMVLLNMKISQLLQLPEGRRNWAEAEKIVKDIAAESPNSITALLARLEYLNARGKPQEALALVESSKAQFPKEVGLWIAASVLLVQEGNFDAARQQLDQAPVPSEPSAALALRLAKIDFWAKRGGAEAGPEIDKLAAEKVQKPADPKQAAPDSDDLLLHESLARANVKLGRVDQARAEIKILQEKLPDMVGIALLQLELASKSGDSKEIEQSIQLLHRIEGDRGVLWRLAQTRWLMAQAGKGDPGRLKEAKEMIAAVESLRPGHPDLPRVRAEIEEMEQRPDQAIGLLSTAVRQGNTQPEVVRRLIQLLADQGRFADADRVIRDLETKRALDPELKRLAAELAARGGNRARTAELVRGSVPASSRNAEQLRWRGRYLATSDPSEQGRAEAEASFLQATAVDPSSADSWLALIEFQMALRKNAQAAESFNKGLAQVAPVSKAIYEALGNQILLRYDKAKAAFEKLLVERPTDKLVLRNAATFYERIEQFRTAEKLWRTLIEQKAALLPTELHDAKISLAALLSKTGKPEDATEALSLVSSNLKAQPGSLRDRRAQIEILSRQPDRRKEAIAYLLELNTSEPLSAIERMKLAQLYIDENLWENAKGEMGKLVNAPNPTSQSIAIYIGMLLNHKTPADLKEAEGLIEKLLVKEPTAFIPVELKARWLIANNRGTEAEALIEQFASKNPSPQITQLIAENCEKLGLQASAERHFKQLAAIPGKPNATLPLALYYARQKRHNEAFDLLESIRKSASPEALAAATVVSVENVKSDKAANKRAVTILKSLIQSDPASRSTQLPTMLAVANSRLGDFDEAERIYRAILKEKPDDVGSLNNLAWLLAIRGKAKEALPLIDAAISKGGTSSQLIDTRGVVELALGQTEQAINDFRDAIATAPDDIASVYLHLAQAQLAANREGEAKKALALAFKAGLTTENLETAERPAYDALIKTLGVPK